jgi:hypothetical protein
LKTRIPIAAAVVLCAIGAVGVISGAPESLGVYLDGDYLRVSLPHIDFLKGKPLDRLKDGASVAFIGQVTIATTPNSINPVARSLARFALSYDIWEERFSITKIGAFPESRSHLSTQAAENWCLYNLVVDRGQIPADQPFYVQIDLRADDTKDQLGIIGDPGINLTRLIEFLGRAPRSPQEGLHASGGPFRLSDLKKTEIRGIRG